MPNSTNLQHVVQEELEWEPSVDASQMALPPARRLAVDALAVVGVLGRHGCDRLVRR